MYVIMAHLLLAGILVFFLPIEGARLLAEPPDRKLALDLTNRYRSLHEDTNALTYGSLSVEQEYTQRWADELKYSDDLRHSGYPDLGENIAFVYGTSLPQALDTAFRMFYDDEIIHWDFERSEPFNDRGVTGHFTQIVWRNTIQMTFAYAYDPAKQRFAFVFNFMPPGNFFGNYASNVGKLKTHALPVMPAVPTPLPGSLELPATAPQAPEMPQTHSVPYVPYVPYAPYVPSSSSTDDDDGYTSPPEARYQSPPDYGYGAFVPPYASGSPPSLQLQTVRVPSCLRCCKCMFVGGDRSSCSITLGLPVQKM